MSKAKSAGENRLGQSAKLGPGLQIKLLRSGKEGETRRKA
jgi:hypothetical protein